MDGRLKPSQRGSAREKDGSNIEKLVGFSRFALQNGPPVMIKGLSLSLLRQRGSCGSYRVLTMHPCRIHQFGVDFATPAMQDDHLGHDPNETL